MVAGNTAAGSADAAARPKNRIAGPDERLGGDPCQRGRFSREFSQARRRMTRAPAERTEGSDPEPTCRLRGMRPSRTSRPWGAILLTKPAEPPVGSRGAREAVSAAEAGPARVWPLAPHLLRAHVSGRDRCAVTISSHGNPRTPCVLRRRRAYPGRIVCRIARREPGPDHPGWTRRRNGASCDR